MTLKALSPLATSYFQAQLQHFAQRASITCALETGGKLTPEAAFHQLETLWQALEQEAVALGIPDDSAAGLLP